jgi:hypothetical protein
MMRLGLADVQVARFAGCHDVRRIITGPGPAERVMRVPADQRRHP